MYSTIIFKGKLSKRKRYWCSWVKQVVASLFLKRDTYDREGMFIGANYNLWVLCYPQSKIPLSNEGSYRASAQPIIADLNSQKTTLPACHILFTISRLLLDCLIQITFLLSTETIHILGGYTTRECILAWAFWRESRVCVRVKRVNKGS